MKKNLRLMVGAAAGLAVAIGFSSCAYDPYYSSTSVGYSSGDGGGYWDGYVSGGSTFSTSLFVGTGDPRWGYDPYTYSYYDYRSRRYYDPYLNGYYPIGYRPPIVYGVPHPHGWRPGRGYIRPPVRVYGGTISNYRDRASAYRGTTYGWSKQVRQGPVGAGRPQGTRPAVRDQRGSVRESSRQNSAVRPSASPSRNSSSRQPSRYNSPVVVREQPGNTRQRAALREAAGRQNRESVRPEARQQRQSGGSRNESRGNSRRDEDNNRVRGYR